MNFHKYMQEVGVRIENRLDVLDSKYWYLPRRLVTAIYFAGFQAGVDETTKLNINTAEMIANGADPDDLLVDMQFSVITHEI